MNESKIAELADRAISIRRIILAGTYTDSYWICDKGHEFAKGRLEHPHECSVCKSPLVEWVSGPRADVK